MERLTQELHEDDQEKEEEQKQKIHERSKLHWRQQAKKKPGPKDKEEDEKLKERFPDGQVSCALNRYQYIILILLFSVSAVSKKDQAG